MSTCLSFLLLLLLLPLLAIAAGIAVYLIALGAAVASPVLLLLARSAALTHDWTLMWHRVGESAVCLSVAIAILPRVMNAVAALPPSCACPPHRDPKIGDYLGARDAGLSIRHYMRRRYGVLSSNFRS